MAPLGPRLITLPKLPDRRGNLTFLQNQDQVPFVIERVFWTYDVPGGEQRGGHAYYQQEELIVALSGSFEVVVHDGQAETTYVLNRSYVGLYLPPLTWRRLEGFATNSLSLHLSSSVYRAEDYIYSFAEFERLTNTR